MLIVSSLLLARAAKRVERATTSIDLIDVEARLGAVDELRHASSELAASITALARR